jgi:hypothetical protein
MPSVCYRYSYSIYGSFSPIKSSKGTVSLQLELGSLCRLYEEEKYFSDTNNVLVKFPVDSSVQQNPSEEITLSVIIPAYNEEKRLAPMMNDCLNYLKTRESVDSKFTYEIIIVNDGRYGFFHSVDCSYSLVPITLATTPCLNG